MKLAGRSDDGSNRKLGNASQVLKQFGDLTAFPLQLRGVCEMLVLAAAAASEQCAARRDAVRRRAQDLQEIRLGEVLVVAEHPGPHTLSGEGKRHHHNPAGARLSGVYVGRRSRLGEFDPPKTDTEIGQSRDFKLDDGVISEGLVVELPFAHERHGTHENEGGEEKDFVFLSVSVSSV
jgi:hypothetical protein